MTDSKVQIMIAFPYANTLVLELLLRAFSKGMWELNSLALIKAVKSPNFKYTVSSFSPGYVVVSFN